MSSAAAYRCAVYYISLKIYLSVVTLQQWSCLSRNRSIQNYIFIPWEGMDRLSAWFTHANYLFLRGNSCGGIWNSRFVEVRLSTGYGTMISNQRASTLVHANTHASRVRGAYSSMIARWSATLPFERERKYKNIEPNLFQYPTYWERFHYSLPGSISIECRAIPSLIEWSSNIFKY